MVQESKAGGPFELQARLDQAELDDVTAKHKSQALLWSKIAVLLTFAQMAVSVSFLLILDTGLIFDPTSAETSQIITYIAAINLGLSLVGWLGASLMTRKIVQIYKYYMILYLVTIVFGIYFGAQAVAVENTGFLYGYFGGLFLLWLATDIACVKVATMLKALENTVFYTN